MTGEALNERVAELKRALRTWMPAGGMDSLRMFEFVQAFHILPNGGGWSDQPRWFLDDMEYFMLWQELETLNQRRTKLPASAPDMAKLVGKPDGR